MPRLLPTLLSASLLLAGCASAPVPHLPAPAAPAAPVLAPKAAAAPAPTTPPDDSLDAVAWVQTALEHNLVYLETYRDAQSQLLTALHDPHWDALAKNDRVVPLNRHLKPAVVLDVDETVLDNSPYQVRLIKRGAEFDAATWSAWCREAKARALPGAVAFTQFAARHGIAVIYITNRDASLNQATLDNLRKDGFPVSGPDAFLGLGIAVPNCEQIGTQKGCRRQLISRKYRVLMQFGDQLGDFVDIMDNRDAGRAQAMAPYMKWIGQRWFVLPNPTYGSWQPALFNNDWSLPRQQRRRDMIKALHDQ
ncbi:5'-nucleotidase, lipoprotein e(P4) family [Dyella sp. A6]|uniref:5'-nucleotidase, lipoprotein e(P4) family n=1 Tax=Dyella aluminiiresistens TaxID=3069105 RepID=UPI002E76125D|nr:HAD family acid phosphatase [Dyella sp. A6]